MVIKKIMLLSLLLGATALGIIACGSEDAPSPTNEQTPTSKRSTTKPAKSKPTKPLPTKGKLATARPTKNVAQTKAVDSQNHAVKDLINGWTEEIIFENELINAIALIQDGDGNLFIYDNCRGEIFKLDSSGSLTQVTHGNNLPIRTMGWQPNQERIIAIVGNALFALEGSKLELVNQFEDHRVPSAIAVNPTDDSFFGCHDAPDHPLNHFDVQGNFLEEIEPSVDGCFQIAYDSINNKVYYSETFSGQVLENDLSTNETKALIQDVGIPGTIEGIAVLLDDQNRLYFFDVYNGLNRYQDGQFVQVMQPASGIGPFIYSTAYNGFVVSPYVGGNLVLYDVTRDEVRPLTPYLNSPAVIELESGEILMADWDVLVEIAPDGMAPVPGVFPERITSMVRDSHGNVYIGTADTSIYQLINGSPVEWTSLDPQSYLLYLSYDQYHDAFVASTDTGEQGTTRVWRIPVQDPTQAEEVVTLENHKAIASVDMQGDIYILEGSDKLYKISKGEDTPVLFASSELEEGRINLRAPNLVYSTVENGFVVGSNEYYELWSLETGEMTKFAVNKCGADNFAIHETKNGDLICIHSGQVFRLKHSQEN